MLTTALTPFLSEAERNGQVQAIFLSQQQLKNDKKKRLKRSLQYTLKKEDIFLLSQLFRMYV